MRAALIVIRFKSWVIIGFAISVQDFLLRVELITEVHQLGAPVGARGRRRTPGTRRPLGEIWQKVEANGWNPRAKAFHLAISLRGDVADILETLPEQQKSDFQALSGALELRFGGKCTKEYSRLQLKSRYQKAGESLQEFAADIQKTHLDAALHYPPDCDRIDVHGKVYLNIAFGDAMYHHMAYVADKNDQFILGLDFLKENNFKLDFKNNESCRYCSRVEEKYQLINPSVHQVTVSPTLKPDPWSDEELREAQKEDPDINPVLELRESSNRRPSWQDISIYSPTTK
ncbi:retroviral-like aspartic protease 1 [Nephila pilipes]|uniref:Retroviral-like aspartic protease 1 n=1 Tax=Nephila pilipes TaxID=299642 RepID=A0A8X6PQC4_NEPPI|nr:retroviral-like aspartic protease 1 [Nephila pilipes]